METEEGNKANVDRFMKELKKWYDEKRKPPEVAEEYEATGPAGGKVADGDSGLNDNRFVGISLASQALALQLLP